MIKNHSKSACTRNGDYVNGWLNSRKRDAASMKQLQASQDKAKPCIQTLIMQPVKLVDGMKACQNASNGMWLKNMTTSQSSSPHETSGSALACYTMMKAVNNGWQDKSYTDIAVLVLNGSVTKSPASVP